MTRTEAEMKLAIDSLTVCRAMTVDCLRITEGSRREHYSQRLAEIDAELKPMIVRHIDRTAPATAALYLIDAAQKQTAPGRAGWLKLERIREYLYATHPEIWLPAVML